MWKKAAVRDKADIGEAIETHLTFSTEISTYNLMNVPSTATMLAGLAVVAVGFWSGLEELKKASQQEQYFLPVMTQQQRSGLLNRWQAALAKT